MSSTPHTSNAQRTLPSAPSRLTLVDMNRKLQSQLDCAEYILTELGYVKHNGDYFQGEDLELLCEDGACEKCYDDCSCHGCGGGGAPGPTEKIGDQRGCGSKQSKRFNIVHTLRTCEWDYRHSWSTRGGLSRLARTIAIHKAEWDEEHDEDEEDCVYNFYICQGCMSLARDGTECEDCLWCKKEGRPTIFQAKNPTQAFEMAKVYFKKF